MTDPTLTGTALIEAFALLAGITTDQARTILEAAGVTVQSEKPAPGTWHIVKDGPQVGDVARVDEDGYLHVIGSNGKTLRDIHPDNTWPDLTPARIVPVAATPATLTEDQVGELHDGHPFGLLWCDMRVEDRKSECATANAILSKYAAPAEGEPIDVADVRDGDRVRLVLDNGDEATVTVTRVNKAWVESGRNTYLRQLIRTIHLLDREGEA